MVEVPILTEAPILVDAQILVEVPILVEAQNVIVVKCNECANFTEDSNYAHYCQI